MKWIADLIMHWRTRRLVKRLRGHLPSEGTIADLGSGAGHNAVCIMERTRLVVRQFDVTDLHWCGPPPELFRERLPLDDNSVHAVLILYVLQYLEDPAVLLREAARVSKGCVIVLQSTCQGAFARRLLGVREFFLGRFGFYLARGAGLVKAAPCSLSPKQRFAPDQLSVLFRSAGLHVDAHEPGWGFLRLRRELFVLSRANQ